MKLLSLLEHLEYKCLQGNTDQEVSSVVYDSRKVEEGKSFYLHQRRSCGRP